ncbi:MFS transporter [Ornithinimicrobium faecis]|uniref:MFS transporter n=1 Tax=Ornithinimicrobium faecis TaxID=2934158 RepID=A0ABY4YP10_9MICO|nr:MFS transporter [Ornithinimicrobium sp. HY1793]USQ78517.1 MFS transporter [Ornithinimicrobium sp. HY1793]
MQQVTTEFRLRDVALTAYGPTVVSAIGHGAVLPMLALRARELGADLGTAAFVVALLGIGQMIASLPAGALVARVGERRALVGAGVLDALAMIGGGLSGSVLWLSVAVVCSGMMWTVFLLARQQFMIEVVPNYYLARALSMLGGSHRVGLFIGPLLGALAVQTWGIRGVFWLGALMALCAAGIALVMPDPGEQVRREQAATGHLSVWSVMRAHRRTLVVLGSVVVVISASRSLRTTLLPLWAEHVHMTPAETSLVFGIAAALDMVLFYPAGWLMDHRGRRAVAVPVVLAVAVGTLLLPLTHEIVGVTAVALLMALGNGLGAGIVMTLGADASPAVGRAQFLGAWRFAGDIGVTGGPVGLSGLLAIAPLAVACVVAGVLGLLGTAWVAAWTGRVDRTRRAGRAGERAG